MAKRSKLKKKVTGQKNPSWEVQLLRLTSFIAPLDVEKVIEGWWKKVVGTDPVKKTEEKTGEIVFEGETNENISILLSVNPFRVDWIYKVRDPFIFSPSPKIKTLGGFTDQLSVISQLSKKWFAIDNLPDIHRIALGANIIFPLPGKDAGYEYLLKFLPVKFKSKEISDFQFRVNEPTKSKATDIKINRLSGWSVLKFDTGLVEVPSQVSHKFPGMYALSVELDINTDKEHRVPIPKNKLNDVFLELVKEGLKISKEGLKDV